MLIFQRMENLLIFIEILGYIAISLMLLQVFLTIGMLACESLKSRQESSRHNDESIKHDNSNESLINNVSSNDSLRRESYV